MDVAKQARGNMLLNLSLERRTIEKAYNYYGTVHSYKGEIAIVVEDIQVESFRASSMQTEADLKIAQASAHFDAFVEDDYVEEKDSSPSAGIAFLVMCLFAAAFLLIF